MGELPQVEVIDDLVHEVTHVLDQRHVAVDVTGGAEPVQDLQAEPVGGLDGGGVEVGDRLAQPAAPSLLLGARHAVLLPNQSNIVSDRELAEDRVLLREITDAVAGSRVHRRGG